jgi:hypothetical protein
MQLPSTAENNVNDTSIAVICGLAISNRRDSPWHRSESAARTTDAALRRVIAIEHRNTVRWCKAVSPWDVCYFSHEAGTAAILNQVEDGFQQENAPCFAVGVARPKFGR